MRDPFRSPEGRALYLKAYDAVLNEWPVPHQALMIDTRLGPTHVVASGPMGAPLLLLLPSLAASAMLWKPNVAGLSRDFRVYAVDTIGQAGKSVAVRRIQGRKDMAGWLNDLMDRLGIARAAMVGSSYGAFLALNQAVLAPERVERLVLIGPAACFVGFGWKFYYGMLIKGPLRRWLGPRRMVKALPGGMALGDDSWGRLMAAAMTQSARPDVPRAIVFGRKALAAVRAPVLLLIGEKEVLYRPQPTIAVAEQRLPGLRGAVIAGAGHLASLAAPEAVNAQMLAFLRSGGG